MIEARRARLDEITVDNDEVSERWVESNRASRASRANAKGVSLCIACREKNISVKRRFSETWADRGHRKAVPCRGSVAYVVIVVKPDLAADAPRGLCRTRITVAWEGVLEALRIEGPQPSNTLFPIARTLFPRHICRSSTCKSRCLVAATQSTATYHIPLMEMRILSSRARSPHPDPPAASPRLFSEWNHVIWLVKFSRCAIARDF